MTDQWSSDQDADTEGSKPSTTLRGAAVSVDPKKAALVVATLCALALAVSGIVLAVAAAHQNAQINTLRSQGITVEATVTTCIGQVAGSGSNPTGYTCQASYRVGGKRYQATLPGSAQRAQGSGVAVVVARDDPTLLSTPPVLATQHASAGAFVLPIVLLAGALGIGYLLWRRHRRAPSARRGVQPARGSFPESRGDDRLEPLGGV